MKICLAFFSQVLGVLTARPCPVPSSHKMPEGSRVLVRGSESPQVGVPIQQGSLVEKKKLKKIQDIGDVKKASSSHFGKKYEAPGVLCAV